MLERRVERRLKKQGYKVTRTGYDHDFKVRKNGRTSYIEVKSGRSALSPRQKRAKAKHGSRYRVIREY